MSYETASFAGFGAGLNLKAKSDAVSEEEAVDAVNVEFTETGAVQQRMGYDELNGSALTNRADSLAPYYESDGTKQLLVGSGTRIEALNTSGAVVASATGLASGPYTFARVGAPGVETAFAGNGADPAYRWDGAAWTSGAAIATVDTVAAQEMPEAAYLAYSPIDFRLVAGGFPSTNTNGGPGGAASSSNPSRVYWSDPGLPLFWDTDNYVDFTPGDGEKVQGIIAWGEKVFIFKETKFFVHTHTNTASDGTPIFDFYPVNTGVGLASPRALTANQTGVYFMARDGVYRTTGGDPEYLSEAVEPIFRGGSSDYFTGGELLHSQITNCAAWLADNRLYLAYTSTGTANDYTLVYDTISDWWSLYDWPAAAGATFRISSTDEVVFAGSSGDNDVYRHNPSLTNDVGNAIEGWWRGGHDDFGLSIVKTSREQKVWGSGKVSMGVSADFAVNPGDLIQLDFTDPGLTTWDGSTWGGGTWAQAAGLKSKLRRVSVRGTVLSTYFFNNVLDQSFAIHRCDHHLRESRVPSIKTGVAA